MLAIPVEQEFQPTLPMRGATLGCAVIYCHHHSFQPTLPMRGATRTPHDAARSNRIPTHAPHAGSDRCVQAHSAYQRNSNPRSPCGERHEIPLCEGGTNEFQPTLPMRGATSCSALIVEQRWYSNPRSPCGERLVESDSVEIEKQFQPTLPMRGATPGYGAGYTAIKIPTHAPHAGSDRSVFKMMRSSSHSNPRSPCGERRMPSSASARMEDSNPRSPCGERHNQPVPFGN